MVEKELGSGAYGVTKLLKDPATGELFAVKYIPRGRQVHTSGYYWLTRLSSGGSAEGGVWGMLA